MGIIVNGTTISNFKQVYFNGTQIDTVYFDGTKVYGESGTYSTLYSFGLAPNSSNIITGVNYMLANYPQAFTANYWAVGPTPNGNNYWYYTLAYGYRMNTSDGIFTPASGSVYLWQGLTVTGANTSHNGGTSVSLQVDNFT